MSYATTVQRAVHREQTAVRGYGGVRTELATGKTRIGHTGGAKTSGRDVGVPLPSDIDRVTRHCSRRRNAPNGSATLRYALPHKPVYVKFAPGASAKTNRSVALPVTNDETHSALSKFCSTVPHRDQLSSAIVLTRSKLGHLYSARNPDGDAAPTGDHWSRLNTIAIAPEFEGWSSGVQVSCAVYVRSTGARPVTVTGHQAHDRRPSALPYPARPPPVLCVPARDGRSAMSSSSPRGPGAVSYTHLRAHET